MFRNDNTTVENAAGSTLRTLFQDRSAGALQPHISRSDGIWSRGLSEVLDTAVRKFLCFDRRLPSYGFRQFREVTLYAFLWSHFTPFLRHKSLQIMYHQTCQDVRRLSAISFFVFFNSDFGATLTFSQVAWIGPFPITKNLVYWKWNLVSTIIFLFVK